MLSPVRFRPLITGLVAALAATFAVLVVHSGPAAAHGNVVSPASRNYGCFERWGSRFQDPAMATEDPMCWRAWQANPNAMWNWNGLFREGVAGRHETVIPDGQLCSAGRTESGRYNAMDAAGNWKTTSIGGSFTVSLFDGARHGADYIRVYVTKPGYDPVTSPLTWSDLELIKTVPNTPAAQWTRQLSNGVQIDIPASAAGRSGRAMVYTIWQASHSDQSYYFCSDVNFGGVTEPTTPPPSSPSTSVSPSTSTPPVAGSCVATHTVTSQWQGGFQGEIKVTAGSAAIKGWTVSLTYPGTPPIQQAWNAGLTVNGNTVQATNVSYNGGLAASGSTSFGFLASGGPAAPTITCAATS
ncbi:lytic polysaccharide monooxygenase [Actinoplanes sp. NEAU-A12]|uniref:Lytic polysaccharide monooxygenase n=1 Tax=Actinoplanes sandaracinus TaxID=3045177 RepID=A0ABT6X1B0_9ACTN|nr:lytic polysaccharide monooxygenase [Actinoplanes sandaracinus]MDI6105806.1 lytic polysaccharide monooxygenase [Actinoplanes sandaracinus]